MSDSSWENILDPGERILWQGRPDGAVVFRIQNAVTFLFGLAFAGFAFTGPFFVLFKTVNCFVYHL